MAVFTNGSRFKRGIEGTFRDQAVIYPEQINFSLLPIQTSYTINNRTAFRPEYISLEIYGRSDLGWILMSFNNIDHVKDLYQGRTIRVPNIQGLI